MQKTTGNGEQFLDKRVNGLQLSRGPSATAKQLSSFLFSFDIVGNNVVHVISQSRGHIQCPSVRGFGRETVGTQHPSTLPQVGQGHSVVCVWKRLQH